MLNNLVQKSYLRLLVLAILLVALCIPRFNRNSFFIEKKEKDARFYSAYVEYFRGEKPSYVLRPATTWRPLGPFLAAGLPFNPLTGLNVVNILLLLGALLLLDKTIIYLTSAPQLGWWGCFLFVLSFPVFYYSTIGYVDPVLIFFCTLGLYFLSRQQWAAVLFALGVGVLAKEGIVVLLPAAAYYFYRKKGPARAFVYSLLLVFMYLSISLLIRKFAPNTTADNYQPEFWAFRKEAFLENFTRFNSYASLLLTIGLPGLLVLLQPWRRHKQLLLQNKLSGGLVLSCLAALATYVFSFLTASADGRTVWTCYPFLIVYLVLLWHQKKKTKQATT